MLCDLEHIPKSNTNPRGRAPPILICAESSQRNVPPKFVLLYAFHIFLVTQEASLRYNVSNSPEENFHIRIAVFTSQTIFNVEITFTNSTPYFIFK